MPYPKETDVELAVTVKAETDKALLIDTGEEEVWIPKSQIVDEGTEVHEKGDSGTIVLTQWIAKAKNLA